MSKSPVIVLAGADERDLTQLTEYRAVGGYAQLERARGLAPSAIIAELNTANLRGGGGAYICGEESGLLESLEGKRGQARSRPPFPATSGLYASPTLINNVETIATIPKILELGGAEYAKIGAPPDSTGTRLFCVSGNVVKGGNHELPMGISMREVIYDLAGGIPDWRELKAVIPGGSAMPSLTADPIRVPLAHHAFRSPGTCLGARPGGQGRG